MWQQAPIPGKGTGWMRALQGHQAPARPCHLIGACSMLATTWRLIRGSNLETCLSWWSLDYLVMLVTLHTAHYEILTVKLH